MLMCVQISMLCSYVRQDSQLWDALHQGVLTTSKFKYALGLDEHKAAGQLGIPRHTVSIRPVLYRESNASSKIKGSATLRLAIHPGYRPE